MESHKESVKNVVDIAAAGTTISALLDMVPATTAVLSLVWVCLRIWETETIRRLTGRWR